METQEHLLYRGMLLVNLNSVCRQDCYVSYTRNSFSELRFVQPKHIGYSSQAVLEEMTTTRLSSGHELRCIAQSVCIDIVHSSNGQDSWLSREMSPFRKGHCIFPATYSISSLPPQIYALFFINSGVALGGFLQRALLQ
eukprot:1601058-Amphidinium_carterae.1